VTMAVVDDPRELEPIARDVRRNIVAMLAEAGSGHSAGPLGMADFMTALYFKILRHDPKNPQWSERDLFFLSNGHTAPVLYAVLAQSGYFPVEELGTLRRLGSRLQGHPERHLLPGLESTSGPLGSGLSQAAGYAYALQYLRHEKRRSVYTAMGDGELNEGNVWEAVMFAAKYRLGQLTAIIDRNFIQIDGSTEAVMPLDDLRAKWEAFGWHAQEIDGHDMGAIVAACGLARTIVTKPSVIIAYTVPGRGVDFMEYDHKWHGKPPSTTEAEAALAQLEGSTR
jgi:transketolase